MCSYPDPVNGAIICTKGLYMCNLMKHLEMRHFLITLNAKTTVLLKREKRRKQTKKRWKMEQRLE